MLAAAFVAAGFVEELDQEERVYGEYHPGEDKIVIHDDRIEQDDVDREMVRVHEELHRWQFQHIPYFYTFVQMLYCLAAFLVVAGTLTLERKWMTYAAVTYLVLQTVVEISVYAATFAITGGYTLGFLGYVMIAFLIHITGVTMQTIGAWALYDPEFVPKKIRPHLGGGWRSQFRHSSEQNLPQNAITAKTGSGDARRG